MADEIREQLRAAQAAEIRGDKAQAIDLLLEAAARCRGAGRPARALQLMRYVLRLDASRADVAAEVHRMEGLAEERAPEARDEMGEEVPAPRERKRLIERGPTLTDPAHQAWCSFCCRPNGEVGRLVAGPAGSFICGGCLRESQGLLGPQLGDGGLAAPAGASPSSSIELLGQAPAVEALERAMRAGRGWILLLGPEGSGKTIYLRQLERQGLGYYVQGAGELLAAPSHERLLLDGLDALDERELEQLCARVGCPPGRQVIIGFRGELGRPSLLLRGGGGALPVFTTLELREATGGRLPLSLLERIQAVAVFRAPGVDELAEIARRLIAARDGELELSEQVVTALVRAAARSPRGGHELESLLGRIPAGFWTLGAGQPPKPRPSRRRPARGRKG